MRGNVPHSLHVEWELDFLLWIKSPSLHAVNHRHCLSVSLVPPIPVYFRGSTMNFCWIALFYLFGSLKYITKRVLLLCDGQLKFHLAFCLKWQMNDLIMLNSLLCTSDSGLVFHQLTEFNYLHWNVVYLHRHRGYTSL